MVDPRPPLVWKSENRPRATIRMPRRRSSPKRATADKNPVKVEVHHFGFGLGPDAAAADERVHQGKHRATSASTSNSRSSIGKPCEIGGDLAPRPPKIAAVMALNSSWAYWDADIGLIGPASMFMKAERFQLGQLQQSEGGGPCQGGEGGIRSSRSRRNFWPNSTKVMVDDAIWVWAVHDLNPRRSCACREGLRPGPELVSGLDRPSPVG